MWDFVTDYLLRLPSVSHGKKKLLELCFYFPLTTNLPSFPIKRRKSEIMIHLLSHFPQALNMKLNWSSELTFQSCCYCNVCPGLGIKVFREAQPRKQGPEV